MSRTEFPNDRLNQIQISLIPNFQVGQLPIIGKLLTELKRVDIIPLQIKELRISKGYDTHVTDVSVELTRIAIQAAADLSLGFYIVQIYIHAAEAEAGEGQINYFYVDECSIIGNEVDGTLVSSNCHLILKSITRYRLELENNIPFEIGGRGGSPIRGAGTNPAQFFLDDLYKMYDQNYGLEEGDDISAANAIFNTSYCDFVDTEHQVHSAPSVGYKMDVPTNMDALHFFFEHYPMFNTVYGWVLDDMSVGTGYPSSLRVSDFIWWPAWLSGVSGPLSKYFNKEIETDTIKDAKNSQDYIAFLISKMLSINPSDEDPYFNMNRFITRDKFPKIWATDVQTGSHIETPAWNAAHQKRLVMVNSNLKIKLKEIDNPMYREFLTFMPKHEIQQTQLYKTLFAQLHPSIRTYTATNLMFGDMDLHTVIHFKQEKLPEEEQNGYDRYGLAYQVDQIYTQSYLHPKQAQQKNTSAETNPQTSSLSPRFTLRTEVAFLIVDAGPLSLAENGQETHAVNPEELVGFDPINHGYSECADALGGTDGDGGGLPGNNNIADQAQNLLKYNTRYDYGGTSITRGIDCSAYVQMAVRATGVKNFPRTVATQLDWVKTGRGKPVSFENVQRGDLVFFWYSGGNRPASHIGIAAGGGKYYHASSYHKRTITSSFRKKPVAIYRIPQPGRTENPEIKKEAQTDETTNMRYSGPTPKIGNYYDS